MNDKANMFPFYLNEMEATLVTQALMNIGLNAQDSELRSKMLINLKADYENSDLFKSKAAKEEK